MTFRESDLISCLGRRLFPRNLAIVIAVLPRRQKTLRVYIYIYAYVWLQVAHCNFASSKSGPSFRTWTPRERSTHPAVDTRIASKNDCSNPSFCIISILVRVHLLERSHNEETSSAHTKKIYHNKTDSQTFLKFWGDSEQMVQPDFKILGNIADKTARRPLTHCIPITFAHPESQTQKQIEINTRLVTILLLSWVTRKVSAQSHTKSMVIQNWMEPKGKAAKAPTLRMLTLSWVQAHPDTLVNKLANIVFCFTSSSHNLDYNDIYEPPIFGETERTSSKAATAPNTLCNQ